MSLPSSSVPDPPRLLFDRVVRPRDLQALDEPSRMQRLGPLLGCLELPFERRQKSRFVWELAGLGPLLVCVPRGQVLRGGERLLAQEAAGHLLIASARESLSWVHCRDAPTLCRAAYHLGNRHVSVEVRSSGLAYQQDPVLDTMLRGLGLSVEAAFEPFEPEAGAYSGGHGPPHA